MGLSTNTYTYSGGSKQFSATFADGYIEQSHVTAYVVGAVDGLGDQVYLNFTWTSESQITVTDSLTVGDEVTVERTVPKDNVLVDLDENGAITREGLSRNNRQALHAVHEVFDGRLENNLISAVNSLLERVNAIDTQVALVEGLAEDTLGYSLDAAQSALSAALVANSAATLLRNNTLVATGVSTYSLEHDLPVGLVFIDGVQQNFSAFTQDQSGREITFVENVPAGAEIEVLYSAGAAAYSLQEFETWDNILTDDKLDYANTQVGASLVSRVDGLSAEVLPSASTDHVAITAGGLRIKPRPSQTGAYPLKVFANVADADDTESLNRAIQNSGSGDIYLPVGTTTADYVLLDKSVRLIGQSRNKTTLNLVGHTTYDGVKAAIAAVGDDAEGLLSTTGINGMTVDVQSADSSVQGLLAMRKIYAQELYIKNAPSNGVLLRSGNPDTQASYFSVFTNVWSKFNGGSGLRITDNSNANVFDTCQFDSNGLHGVHQIIVGTGPGINQVAYSNVINQGQASFNQYDGVYVQNGANMQIRGLYGEFNSQVDGGNQKTGAGKLLRMGSTVTRCNMVFGEIGTDIDVQDAFALNNVLNNYVAIGGHVLTPYNDIELGYSNYGTGRKIVFNGVGGCEHVIEFRESTSVTSRIRYNGGPGNPSNELLFEVTSDNGTTWKKVIQINNNGHMAFFGETPVAQQGALADVPTGGSATAADNAAAINLLKYKLEQLGLMET